MKANLNVHLRVYLRPFSERLINQGFFVEMIRHVITALLLLYESRIKLIK